ncbi:hypothetical protein ACJ41O_006936 [Fusarium nematophilum]
MTSLPSPALSKGSNFPAVDFIKAHLNQRGGVSPIFHRGRILMDKSDRVVRIPSDPAQRAALAKAGHARLKKPTSPTNMPRMLVEAEAQLTAAYAKRGWAMDGTPAREVGQPIPSLSGDPAWNQAAAGDAISIAST